MPPDLAIVLTSAPEVSRGAQGFVAIRVVNTGDRAIRMVGVVDGSETGARYPRWTPIVDGPSAPRPERPDFVAPLTVADVRSLGPGESFDPTASDGGARFYPITAFEAISEVPGRYSIALELDATGADPEGWSGTLPDRRPSAASDAAAVAGLLDLVPRIRAVSNTLTVIVR